ncbi:PP2C family protein-serine/threonine phosphatase [Streptomyces sp. NPDC048650]|uniref:PP2C family protein-serine/threonine phosphatase n=1 Tax=Streptomyces sp. NPDC048650 TaxID=3365583 RepID=UPI0037138EB3
MNQVDPMELLDLVNLVDQAVVTCDAAGVVCAYNRPAAGLFPLLRVGEALSASAAGPMALATEQGADGFDAAFEGRVLLGHRETLQDHVVWLVRDVSAVRACEDTLLSERHRSAFLERAGRRLSASLHHGRSVRTLVRIVRPELADMAVAVLPVHGRGTVWHRAGPADTEESGQVSAAALQRIPVLADALSGLQSRPAVASRHELDGLGDAVPAERGEGGEALVVQLAGNGVSAGALILVRGPERAGFTAPDVELAGRFAERAGLALATADLYSQQARSTAVLQESLAPEPLPSVEGVRLGAAYRPAAQALRISGDFYRVAPHPGAGVAFFFGDVCGKGAEAAVLAGLVRQSLRTLALTETDPVRALYLLNQALLGDESRFTTLVNGTAGPAPGGGLTVVTAGGGHLPPLILRRDGRVEQVAIDGTLVGILPDPFFDRADSHLAPGELMLLYSDGVTEARGGPTGQELYGDERLSRELADCLGMPAGAVAERVELLTTQWLGGRSHDDIAVLVLQAPPDPRRGETSP